MERNIKNKTAKSNSKYAENYEYLLIIDFECQCLKGEQLDVQEIIEFPVVIVDVKKMKILDEIFHFYIKPVHHPILTDYCLELTGITQEQVNNGILLEEALTKFDLWLNKLGFVKDKKKLKNFSFVTDGNADLNKFLRREAAYKKIYYPHYLCEWFDLREEFRRFTGVKGGIKKMLSYYEMTFEGNKHSGIDDSKNIAKIVLELIKEGFKFNRKYLKTSYEKKKDTFEDDINYYLDQITGISENISQVNINSKLNNKK